jgi:hypothetical protein
MPLARDRLALALALALGVSCGRTAPWPEAEEVGDHSSSVSSADTSTGGPGETTSESGSGSAESSDGSFIPGDSGTETGIDPKTCREMLECLLGCLAQQDPNCIAMCGEGADPGELQAAGALMACILGQCVQLGECQFPDFGAQECVGCIGLGLFLPEPPGCEAEAMACE